VRDAAAAALIGAGVAVELLACAGVARMRTALARLHYTAPGPIAAVLVAAGLVVHDGFSQSAGRGLMLAALLVLSGPPIAHATARALHRRGAR
jgi:multisubunit Na+/H+ antiporter MnhG subunit